MYRSTYSHTLEDDPAQARGRERAAFDHAISLLRDAEEDGPGSPKGVEALRFLERFWMLLLEDLANDGNELPQALRASLISIGIWISREAQDIRSGKVSNFGGLIEINSIIRDGLQ